MNHNNHGKTNIPEVELVYRPEVKLSDLHKINFSFDAYTLFRITWNMDQIQLREQFKVMLCNRANRVLGIIDVAQGGIHQILVDPKLIFAAALKAAACEIILCHNHPSGSSRPGDTDKMLTRNLQAAGALLEIKVRDHIIITSEDYFSFADEGLL
jgi:DNA repair protein RadC